ncbi:TetR/AcrR family transcriptional regulator [Actinoplanes sp. NPDC051343]|uniref:TetR/AcrR family transcriptional regulator n=1 Tax=Actinoplanes sp. NPDC051343 TaxID=3363906 RepID=UPI00379C9B6C
MAGTRRRGEELEATILDAAWAEIMENGYPRLTMEGVAARARTGKQVIYRRWPDRAHLAIAAIRHTLGPLVSEVPQTGSLRGDLLSVLRRMADRGRQYRPDLFYGLLAEAPDSDTGFGTVLPGVIRAILQNAVARGELAHADLPPRVVSLPADLLRYEGLRNAHRWGQDAAEAEIEQLLADILDDVFLPLVLALAGPPDAPMDVSP